MTIVAKRKKKLLCEQPSLKIKYWKYVLGKKFPIKFDDLISHALAYRKIDHNRHKFH